jgi:hypothetical protein
MTSERHVIKVDKEITPIHYTKRTEPELTVGGDYFVSFGNNIAFPCTIKEIKGGRNKRVVITKYDNDKEFGEHVVFSNEIGVTPRKQSEILQLFENNGNVHGSLRNINVRVPSIYPSPNSIWAIPVNLFPYIP